MCVILYYIVCMYVHRCMCVYTIHVCMYVYVLHTTILYYIYHYTICAVGGLRTQASGSLYSQFLGGQKKAFAQIALFCPYKISRKSKKFCARAADMCGGAYFPLLKHPAIFSRNISALAYAIPLPKPRKNF